MNAFATSERKDLSSPERKTLGKVSCRLDDNLPRLRVSPQSSSLLPKRERTPLTSTCYVHQGIIFPPSPESWSKSRPLPFARNLFDFRVTILKWREWKRAMAVLFPPSRTAFVPRGCCVNIAAGPRETRKPSNLETKVGNEPCNVARCHPPPRLSIRRDIYCRLLAITSHFVDFDYLRALLTAVAEYKVVLVVRENVENCTNTRGDMSLVGCGVNETSRRFALRRIV